MNAVSIWNHALGMISHNSEKINPMHYYHLYIQMNPFLFTKTVEWPLGTLGKYHLTMLNNKVIVAVVRQLAPIGQQESGQPRRISIMIKPGITLIQNRDLTTINRSKSCQFLIINFCWNIPSSLSCCWNNLIIGNIVISKLMWFCHLRRHSRTRGFSSN